MKNQDHSLIRSGILQSVASSDLVSGDSGRNHRSRPRSFFLHRSEHDIAITHCVRAGLGFGHHRCRDRPITASHQLVIVPEVQSKAAAWSQREDALLQSKQSEVALRRSNPQLRGQRTTIEQCRDIAAVEGWFDGWRESVQQKSNRDQKLQKVSLRRHLLLSVATLPTILRFRPGANE